MEHPKVSILIPARNEEHHLPRLFESLDQLTYPKEYLEILLGNDQSTDATFQMMVKYAQNKPWVKVVQGYDEPELKGKTKMLAQLSDHASGEYYCFTDADIRLPRHWIEGLLKEMKPKDGVVVGATTFEKTSLFSRFQGMEWLCVLSLCYLGSLLSIPSTGLGNNMMVRKEAYWAVGGYRGLGFNIVEDYYLYRKIIQKGYGFRHVLLPEILTFTVPPDNYLEQRKRWIKGAYENNKAAFISGLIQALIFPLLLLIGFYNLKLALSIYTLLTLFYALVVGFANSKLKLSNDFVLFPILGIYLSCSWLIQVVSYIFTSSVPWKGREYST